MPPTPKLPEALPEVDIACPLGTDILPQPTTPATTTASQTWSNLMSGSGLHVVEQWAWEVNSDAGSLPSVWSKASTPVCNVEGDGLVPGLIEGQRLSYVKPCTVLASGGRVVISLRREVPQGYWDRIDILLIQDHTQVKLAPIGIKKGRKLAVEVPAGMKLGDYDVRLSLSGRVLHGAVQLTVGDVIEEGND